MIFITGDTHGNYRKLNTQIFPEQKEMCKTDYVIVCGDFGIWKDDHTQKYWLQWLDEKPFTTLFVDGNHENFDLLATYPITDWNGGKVQFISKSVIHLMRGEIYNIDGKTFFTMGGASSHDISDGILEPTSPDFKLNKKKLDKQNAMYRVNHISWWKEELPSDDEYKNALDNFEKYDFKVDYIISHSAPTHIVDVLGGGLYQNDRLTNFFEDMSIRVSFDYWFFGHYHDNRHFDRKYILLYEQILEVT